MIVLFEDQKSIENLKPFSLVRPIQSLKSGIFDITQRYNEIFKSEIKLFLRSELWFYYPETSILSFQDISRNNTIKFLNSSYLFPEKSIINLSDVILTHKDKIVLVATESSNIHNLETFLEGIFTCDVQKVQDSLKNKLEIISKELNFFAEYTWNYMEFNPTLIEMDFEILKEKRLNSIDIQEIEFEGDKENIIILSKAKIWKNVFFDVTSGPVFVDEMAEIKPFSIIQGPSYIGKKSIISQARLREGSNIRKVCKISGEVEESIIDDFSNKNHEGFIGHSYIGQWVNIGAMATNSDLKNTYDEVKVFVEPRKVVNTNLLKVGCFVGDFSKIGIGTLINTGTVIGIGANVFFEGELVRKYVPNFAWGGKEPYKRFPLDRFINMLKTMYSRRGLVLPKTLENLITNLYNLNIQES